MEVYSTVTVDWSFIASSPSLLLTRQGKEGGGKVREVEWEVHTQIYVATLPQPLPNPSPTPPQPPPQAFPSPLPKPSSTPLQPPFPAPRIQITNTPLEKKPLIHAQYYWTTGAPDNGNEWRKFRAVPRLNPLRSLVLHFV